MNPDTPLSNLGNLSPRAFLADVWGRTPRLVRKAFDPLPWRCSPEALAGLALEPGVEARLFETRESNERVVTPGPLEEDDFTTLPESRWTLLVQDLERWFPGASAVVEPFRFLPNVRLDDLMVSAAADRGGVGAHADRYDVFLIQLEGRRRWRIEREARSDREEFGAGFLSDFSTVDEWVLETGDLLYLPPRVAHEGIAIGRCVTASVGFRAPSIRTLLKALGATTIPEEARLWRPPNESFAVDPGRIPPEWAPALAETLTAAVGGTTSFDERAMMRALGCNSTNPRGERPAPAGRPLDPGELRRGISNGAVLARTSVSRFGWSEHDDGIDLFVGGRLHPLQPNDRAFAQALCGRGPLDHTELGVDDDRFAVLVADLVDAGDLSLDRPDI